MAKIDYTGATNLEIATYSGSSCITVTAATSNVTWLTVTSFNNGSIKANVSANTSDSGRTAQITVGYKADENPCSKTFSAEQGTNECTCGDMRVSPTAISWSSSDVSNKQITLTPSSCINSITASNNNTTDFTMTRNGNIITVKPKGENPSATTPKSGVITISYSAGTTIGCSSAVTITQQAVGCNCENLTVSPTSMSWAYDETGDKTVTIDADPCVNITSVVIDEGDTTAFTASYDASTNKVTVSPVDQNPGQTPYDAELTVYYTAGAEDCHKTTNLRQGTSTCSCNDLDFITSALEWDSHESETKYAYYRADPCVTDISASHTNTSDFDIYLDTSNKRVEVRPYDNNTSSSPKTDTISLSYKASATDCPARTIGATQNAYICDCDDITWTILTTNIDKQVSPSTGDVIANYSFGECDGSIVSVNASSTTPGEDWITALTPSNGNIIVSGAPNPTLSNDRSGVVTITYKPNVNTSTPCTKTITVSQTSVPCGCEHISKYIFPIETVFYEDGSHGERILVASGDTHGCGTLTADTTSDNFLDGGLLEVVPVVPGDYSRVYFYATVLRWNNPESTKRTQGSGIRFKSSVITEECTDTSLKFEQYSGHTTSNDCSDFIISGVNKSIDCKEHTSLGRDGELAYIVSKYPDIDMGDDITFFIMNQPSPSQRSWVSYGIDDVNKVFKVYSAQSNINDASSARTLSVQVGILNKRTQFPCDGSSSLTFTQSGCTLGNMCNCNNITFKEGAYNYIHEKVSGLSNSTHSIRLWDKYNSFNYVTKVDNEECDYSPEHLSAFTFSVSTTPTSASSWIHINGFNLEIDSVSLDETFDKREADITLDLYVDGNKCDSLSNIHVSQDGRCNCNSIAPRRLHYRITADTDSWDDYMILQLDENDEAYVGVIQGCAQQIRLSTSDIFNRCIKGSTVENLPSWMRSVSVTTTQDDYVYIDVDRNDTQADRTAEFKYRVTDGSPCEYTLRITQSAVCETCDCYMGWISRSSNIINHDYQEVMSGTVASSSCINYLVDANPPVLDLTYELEPSSSVGRARIHVSAATKNQIVDGGCSGVTITLGLQNIDEQPPLTCASSSMTFTATSCSNDFDTDNDAGTVVSGNSAYTCDSVNLQTIGTIVGSKAGDTSKGFGCYYLSATTQSTTEVQDLQIVENNGIFEIKARLVRQSSPSIDVNLRKRTCDGDKFIITLGGENNFQFDIRCDTQ